MTEMTKELGLLSGGNSSTVSDELNLLRISALNCFPFFLLTDKNLLLYLDSSRLLHKANTKTVNPEIEDGLGFLVVIHGESLKMGC